MKTTEPEGTIINCSACGNPTPKVKKTRKCPECRNAQSLELMRKLYHARNPEATHRRKKGPGCGWDEARHSELLSRPLRAQG